jgi:hypothetical protein
MEFGNQHYYEITIRQRHRELLREAESSRLLKQANLPQEKRIARLMLKFKQVIELTLSYPAWLAQLQKAWQGMLIRQKKSKCYY